MRHPITETITCPCGKSITRVKNTGRIGKSQKFCSVECRVTYTTEKFNYKY